MSQKQWKLYYLIQQIFLEIHLILNEKVHILPILEVLMQKYSTARCEKVL